MPKIRREHLPPGLFNHLLDRISDRQISASQLEELADWLDTEPDVPEGRWFRKFSGMCVCREGTHWAARVPKALIISAPIPRELPVTSATFPLKFRHYLRIQGSLPTAHGPGEDISNRGSDSHWHRNQIAVGS